MLWVALPAPGSAGSRRTQRRIGRSDARGSADSRPDRPRRGGTVRLGRAGDTRHPTGTADTRRDTQSAGAADTHLSGGLAVDVAPRPCGSAGPTQPGCLWIYRWRKAACRPRHPRLGQGCREPMSSPTCRGAAEADPAWWPCWSDRRRCARSARAADNRDAPGIHGWRTAAPSRNALPAAPGRAWPRAPPSSADFWWISPTPARPVAWLEISGPTLCRAGPTEHGGCLRIRSPASSQHSDPDGPAATPRPRAPQPMPSASHPALCGPTCLPAPDSDATRQQYQRQDGADQHGDQAGPRTIHAAEQHRSRDAAADGRQSGCDTP